MGLEIEGRTPKSCRESLHAAKSMCVRVCAPNYIRLSISRIPAKGKGVRRVKSFGCTDRINLKKLRSKLAPTIELFYTDTVIQYLCGLLLWARCRVESTVVERPYLTDYSSGVANR